MVYFKVSSLFILLLNQMTFCINSLFSSSGSSALFGRIPQKSVQKLPKLRFLAIFLTLHYQFSLILHIMIGGHDFQLFSYNSPIQSICSCFNLIFWIQTCNFITFFLCTWQNKTYLLNVLCSIHCKCMSVLNVELYVFLNVFYLVLFISNVCVDVMEKKNFEVDRQ